MTSQVHHESMYAQANAQNQQYYKINYYCFITLPLMKYMKKNLVKARKNGKKIHLKECIKNNNEKGLLFWDSVLFFFPTKLNTRPCYMYLAMLSNPYKKN